MRYLLTLVILLVLPACGYHFPGQGGALPGGVEKLYIPLFINKTSEVQLDNKLTSRVTEVFARNHKLSQVESPEQADALLEGRIDKYQSRALSYDKNDDISEYRATMIVSAQLRSARSKEVLWQKSVTWSVDYTAANNKALQADLEKQAIDEISLRIAEELFYQLLDDF